MRTLASRLAAAVIGLVLAWASLMPLLMTFLLAGYAAQRPGPVTGPDDFLGRPASWNGVVSSALMSLLAAALTGGVLAAMYVSARFAVTGRRAPGSHLAGITAAAVLVTGIAIGTGLALG